MTPYLNRRYFSLLILTSVSACGGNIGQSDTTPPQKTPPIAKQEFTDLAKNTACAEYKNRLFIIDQQYVLWDKAGACHDASFSQTLFSHSPQTTLCQFGDSIAGPRFNCNNKSLEAMFQTMVANLDKADLGLGQTHQIQTLSSIEMSKNQVAIPIRSYHSNFYYNTDINPVVIRNGSAWELFWKNAYSTLDVKDSQPDFKRNMVLGSFYKTLNNCSISQIVRVASNGERLSTEYFEQERVAIRNCAPQSTRTATPMNLVETLRLELPVEFINVSQHMLATQVIAQGQTSHVSNARQIVIKDQVAWTKLWQEHLGQNLNPPAVNFNTHMVIGLFLGSRSNGCYAIDDVHVWRKDGATKVSYRAIEPSANSFCTMQITSPYSLLIAPLNNDIVSFNAVHFFK